MKQVYLSLIFNGNAHAQLASQFFQGLEILAEIADAFLTGSALRRKGVDNRPFRAQDGCRADAALLQQAQMLRVQRLIARIVGGYAVRLTADDACALIGLAQGVYLRFPGVVI